MISDRSPDPQKAQVTLIKDEIDIGDPTIDFDVLRNFSCLRNVALAEILTYLH